MISINGQKKTHVLSLFLAMLTLFATQASGGNGIVIADSVLSHDLAAALPIVILFSGILGILLGMVARNCWERWERRRRH